jgi:hypothetical protein
VARYSASATKTTGAAAAWAMALRQAATTRDMRVFEIGLFSTTAVAGTYELRRTTAAGTGTATTVLGTADDPQSSAGTGTVDTAFATTVPTATGTALRSVSFPATAGSGVIWTFPTGIVVPAAGGLSLMQTSALAVGLLMYCAWDE